MTITVSTENETGLLVCHLIGMTDQEQYYENLPEIKILREKTGFNLILVDATKRKESLGMMELLEIGEWISSAFPGARMAVYASTPQPGLEFTRSVCISSQALEMRIFRDECTARAWLNNPDDEQG